MKTFLLVAIGLVTQIAFAQEQFNGRCRLNFSGEYRLLSFTDDSGNMNTLSKQQFLDHPIFIIRQEFCDRAIFYGRMPNMKDVLQGKIDLLKIYSSEDELSVAEPLPNDGFFWSDDRSTLSRRTMLKLTDSLDPIMVYSTISLKDDNLVKHSFVIENNGNVRSKSKQIYIKQK